MSPWVLLRGLTRESAHWGRFPEVFANALPETRLVMLDLPGNGVFHSGRSPASVTAMAQACRAELRHLGMAPPYHLLAMSLGAMVATEWARQAPGEVAGSVLINTSLRPFSAFYRRLRPSNYGRLLRLGVFESEPREIEAMVWRLTSNQRPPDGAILAHWLDVRRSRPVSPGNALRQLWAAARYRAPALPPVRPTLLLASEQDRLVSSACSMAIARAWDLPLVMHPWAGHDLPLDDADWVAEQVRLWLASGPPGVR
jgi:pimeloyl-ACP methyl ester carboxylesterase